MRMRVITGACIVIALVAVILAAIGLNSYVITLNAIGFEPKNTIMLHSWIEQDGTEYRIVAELIHGEMPAVKKLNKSKLGFWTEAKDWVVVDSSSEFKTVWSRAAGWRYYNFSHDRTSLWDNHMVYCGNNATREIFISSEQLPANTTVEVQQSGSAYILHFVTYGRADTLNDIDPYLLLKDADCVE